jgi:hypothetical protein
MRIPAMLSTYAVPGELPARPAPNVAKASTISPRRRLIGLPSGAVRPAARETPMNVESESKRSVKRIEMMAGSSASCSAPTGIELQEHRREIGPAHELLRPAGQTRAPGQRRHDEDRGEERQRVAAPHQRNRDEHAEQHEERAVIDGAEAHERDRVAGHQSDVPQADEREQQADAGGRGDTQVVRDRGGNALAQRRRGDEQEEHAGPEHHAERHRPRHALLHHDGVGEERVQPHAGRDGEGEARVKAHRQRHRRRDQHRGGEHAREGHAGPRRREDRGIDDDDVGHRHEGGDPADDLAGPVQTR